MPEQFIKVRDVELRLSMGEEIDPQKIYKERDCFSTVLGFIIDCAARTNGEIDTVEVSFRNYKRAYKVLESKGYFWREEKLEKNEKPSKSDEVCDEVSDEKELEILYKTADMIQKRIAQKRTTRKAK